MTSRPSSLPPITLVLSILWATIAGLALSGCGEKGEKAPAPAAPSVEVTEVVQKDTPIISEWIGTLDGSVNATVRAQVSGYLVKQNYKEGTAVKAGELLFEIDPRPFQSALEKAKAQVAQAEARWQTAKANLARVRPLVERNAMSKRDLDIAVGSEQAAQSEVEAAKAALDKADLDLGFTKITSPVDGIAGIAKAQIGDLVGPQAVSELTTVSTIDPMKVYVEISEAEYLQFSAAREANKNAPPAEKRKIDLYLVDGSLYPQSGEVAFGDRQVNPETGTLKVAVLFPNPTGILRPGMYSRVKAAVSTRQGALMVPQRAVTDVQGKHQVAVVGPDNKVSVRPVKAGARVDNLWIIDEGLSPGDKVVTEGLQKVRDGITVVPVAAPGAASR